jgi:hypothetical protein
MFAALMTVLAAVYLLSTIRLRRRLRAARKDDDRAGVASSTALGVSMAVTDRTL